MFGVRPTLQMPLLEEGAEVYLLYVRFRAAAEPNLKGEGMCVCACMPPPPPYVAQGAIIVHTMRTASWA